MFPINQFKIEAVSQDDTSGVFKVGPLPKGYANTLGTVMRRILLSSIPGAAVTAVKIDGVQHEYTTIAGLKDDVLSLVLSMKQLSVTSHSDDPVELELKKKGTKGEVTKVTAADFTDNPMVDIANPELEITSLADDKAEIDIKVVVEKGIGYSLADEGKRNEVGAIPIDSVFSPVKQVSITAQNTRVGQQTDLDELLIDLKTDGTVLPEVAVHQSAEILHTMTVHLVEATNQLMDEQAAQTALQSDLPIAEEIEEPEVEEVEPLQIDDPSLDLSTRLTNALTGAGYEDLRELDGLTEEEVRNIEGLGAVSYDELIDVLKENEIKLI